MRAATIAIPLLTLAAWWPLSPWWQSDDFLAVTYAADWRRALADFTGNQYGAPALVWFYRPLITLSFALDVWLGGTHPFVAHLSNALAHAVSTLLLALLGRRLLGDHAGLGLALLWGLWPTHAGSILWAVGRVDSHTTVWILASCGATLRWLDRGRGRALAVIAFALALLSKELAFVTPALAALLGFATGAPASRLRRSWQAAWPLLVVFAVYLPWRWLVLGRLVGGYAEAAFAPGPALAGLATWVARLADPLLSAEPAPAAARLAGFAVWPLALFGAWRRRRLRAVLLLLIAFSLCAVPTAPFWAHTGEERNVRYFYLPAACALAVVAVGGTMPLLAALAVAAWPLVQVRAHYVAAHRTAAAMHGALRAVDAGSPPGALLVHGLPRENAARDVLLFHLFVDRLLLPPFGSGRQVLALRPLAQRPDVLRIPDATGAALPGVRALALTADGGSMPLAPSPLPELPVEVEGSLHLDSQTMWDLHRGRTRAVLRFPGDRSPHYRLTLFTAGGYLSCILANAAPDAADGEIEVASIVARGRYASDDGDTYVARALAVPAALDLSTSFPLLVEAGAMAGSDMHAFVARARAARPLALRLDRDYCAWLAGEVGDQHGAR